MQIVISVKTRKYGLPYRRGYLFYGPPGTGKTSLAMALAGHFNLKVCVLSLNMGDMYDSYLSRLFAEIPSRSLVIIEDIDVVTTARDDTDTDKMLSSMSANQVVSLSALLNAIDGIAAAEGRLLVMTTKHLEKLDPALIRPGRCDLQFEFKLTTRDEIYRIFERFYFNVVSKVELPNYARQFADLMPEQILSMAQLQGLLLQHYDRPDALISQTPTWVEETKEQMARDESFRKGKEKKKEAEAKAKAMNAAVAANMKFASEGNKTSGDHDQGDKQKDPSDA
ncbi:putative mitochondrial chaperone BCS1-A [Neolecta irregularis DAH-3]|uniref:Putative mitochondrial chaperone BCS1-A n=1 Tax=Neolecta irregularis (strain DAH-3) TaxID=1198029 RepID=A0A1U7LKG9_NEOID|nr:putative mitochondrial chaperone BCS1-A [Neolecta irregularis DAH-3]|eukprot:OLL23139.1 putative mitochondrial chaperone BCS1-A [Neolecta irregularis DAH-3]